nr:hypothetical protein Iba_chr12eCG8000 [Ipomoea batatas]
MDFFNEQGAEESQDLWSRLSSRMEPNNMAWVPPPEPMLLPGSRRSADLEGDPALQELGRHFDLGASQQSFLLTDMLAVQKQHNIIRWCRRYNRLADTGSQ